MKIKLIVAASENNVIGIKNNLPWNLPNDMQYFKNMTTDSVVIMGKKNYLSIPEKFRPLKNRINIVLTREPNYCADSCLIANSLESAIQLAKEQNKKSIFIIGGGMVYKYALDHNLVDIIYLTRVHANINGDISFPNINLKKWRKVNEVFHPKDNKHKFAFTFLTFEKLT